MSRKPRIQFPGALYHVMSRGNRKDKIFMDDDDRYDFIEKFTGVISQFGWECYAYCLLDNHYHLLVKTPQANISEGMHKLLNDYCKRFNWKHGQVGHVMQGRFGSPLVEKEEHLMEIVKYIALNPVKASLVSKPEQWKWNSYPAIAGFAPAPGFLDIEYTLDLFGDNAEMARQAYIRFIDDALLLWYSTEQNRRPTLQELFQVVWDKHQRNSIMRIAYHEHRYTMTEISTHLRLSLSAVSRAINK